jgi:hypothetical protein
VTYDPRVEAVVIGPGGEEPTLPMSPRHRLSECQVDLSGGSLPESPLLPYGSVAPTGERKLMSTTSASQRPKWTVRVRAHSARAEGGRDEPLWGELHAFIDAS